MSAEDRSESRTMALTIWVDRVNRLLRNGTPPLGPEFSLSLDLLAVTTISIVMLTLAALSFRRKEKKGSDIRPAIGVDCAQNGKLVLKIFIL